MAENKRDQQEQVARQRAQLLQVAYVDTRTLKNVDPNVSALLSTDEMKDLVLVPLEVSPHKVEFGFSVKTPQSSLKKLLQRFPQLNLHYSFISETGFEELYQKYYQATHHEEKADPQEVANRLAKAVLDTSAELQKGIGPGLLTAKLNETPQKELFEFIVQQGYLLGSSDIHIEPGKTQTRIRFRIDGRLHPVATLNVEKYNVLLTDIQVRGKIKWNSDYPQTGSINHILINTAGQQVPVNMRLETIPTVHGSDVVIRIFNMDTQFLNMDNLGLNQRQQSVINELITHPHGLVLMVGPTGSGKTSTQYAIINQLNSPEVKIVTLEDPVEYELEGITQIPVHSEDKELFSEKLRAVLREDPDIIMLGEIRDADTAKTALQAALTGHLVLSTFHAASAAAAVSRLMDTIGQNPLLASALRLIMAQRLVRRICPHCKEAYTPDEKIIETIKESLKTLPLKDLPKLENPQLYRGAGCPECHHIGYLGRLIVAEQLLSTPELEKFIASGTSETTTAKIHELAVKQGMITLLQDGLLKALAGETSIEEVFRVVEV